MSTYKCWAVKQENGDFARDSYDGEVMCALFPLRRDAKQWKRHYVSLDSAKIVKVTVTVEEAK